MPILIGLSVPVLRRQAMQGGRSGDVPTAVPRARREARRRGRPVLRRLLRLRRGRDAARYHEARCRARGEASGTRLRRRAPGDGNVVHRERHRCRLHAHRPIEAGRVRVLLVARLLGTVPASTARSRSPCPSGGAARTPAPVLPAVARLLAVEHRQGSLDDVQPRDRRVRRGEDPHDATWRGILCCVAGLWLPGWSARTWRRWSPCRSRLRWSRGRARRSSESSRPIVKGVFDRRRRDLRGRAGRPLGSVPPGRRIDTSRGRLDADRRAEPHVEGGSSFSPSIVDSPARAPSRRSPCCSARSSSRRTTSSRSWRRSRGPPCWSSALPVPMGDRCLAVASTAAVRRVLSRLHVLFIVAFSSFANFGLLARERVQLYPLFLVLFSIPPATLTTSVPSSHVRGPKPSACERCRTERSGRSMASGCCCWRSRSARSCSSPPGTAVPQDRSWR